MIPLETVIDSNGNHKWLTIKEKQVAYTNNQEIGQILQDNNPLETIKEIELIDPGQYECLKCGKVICTNGAAPLECYQDQGGCGRVTNFETVVPQPITGYWKDIHYKNMDVCDLDLINTMLPVIKDSIIFEKEIEYLPYFLWNVATWKYDCFQSVPYASFMGPIKSGKTRALDIIRELGYHTLSGAYISLAAIPRMIELYHTTITLDEASDAFWKKSTEGRDLLRIFKAGYRKGQKYIIADVNDPDNVIAKDVFGFKAMASEQALDTALQTRSITWWMREATPTIQEMEELNDQFEDIRSKLLIYRYKCSNPPELPHDFPLTGRIREIFTPLFRVALSLGVDTTELLEYARQQEARQQEEIFGTLSALILGCIYDKYTGFEERHIVHIKDIATECDEKASTIGYKLRDLGIVRKRSKDGMFISLEDPETIDRLEYLFRKFGISEKVKAFQQKLGNGEGIDEGL